MKDPRIQGSTRSKGGGMRLIVLVSVAFFSLTTSADASGMRCKGKLVSEGDSTTEVLLKCGEPLTRETLSVGETDSAHELVERWVYSKGAGSFLRLLTFQAGKLISVESADRQ